MHNTRFTKYRILCRTMVTLCKVLDNNPCRILREYKECLFYRIISFFYYIIHTILLSMEFISRIIKEYIIVCYRNFKEIVFCSYNICSIFLFILYHNIFIARQ